jgi:hypothetical protein
MGQRGGNVAGNSSGRPRYFKQRAVFSYIDWIKTKTSGSDEPWNACGWRWRSFDPASSSAKLSEINNNRKPDLVFIQRKTTLFRGEMHDLNERQ